MQGRLNSEADDLVKKIICEEVYDLMQVPGELTKSLLLIINKTKISEEKINFLKNLLASHRGKIPVYFRVSINGKSEINMVSKNLKIAMSNTLLEKLEHILSFENIKVKVS
jgi:DNA polymerase III alpha subunit